MRSARLAVLVGAASIAGTLVPGSAAAAVTCQYNGASKTLEVFEDSAATIVRSGSNITVVDPPDVVSCSPGGATVDNTDSIVIAETGSSGYLTTIDFSGGPFAPGADNEGGSSDEIEFGLQGVNHLDVRGTGGVDHFRFGINGGIPVANFNAGAETGGILTPGVDDDANLFDTQDVRVSAGGSNDVIRGDGGVGTGSAFPRPLDLFGGVGEDQLIGGEGDDRLGYLGLSSDEAGNDTIGGGAGDDRISAAPGDDQITGGSGADAATYFNAPSGLTIDLATSGQQNTGGGGLDTFSQVEEVSGSAFDDTLLGDGAANILTGGAGNDLIDGRAGEDELHGDDVVNSGNDTVVVRDGGHDKATCGPESDTVIADLAGVDTIDPDCENVDFATFTPPPPDGGGSDTAIDVVLSAKKKQDAVKQKGLLVRAICPDENCDVTASGSIRLPRARSAAARAKARPVKLRAVSESLPAGVTEPLGLRLPKKGSKRTSAALEDRRRLPAVVRISATDLAGNRDTAKVKVKVID